VRLTAVDARMMRHSKGGGNVHPEHVGTRLVIEISGGRNEPGTALQVGVKRPVAAPKRCGGQKSALVAGCRSEVSEDAAPPHWRAPDGICAPTGRDGVPGRGGLRFILFWGIGFVNELAPPRSI